eukprot:4773336-Amphidinium_carterae.2
MHRCSCWSLLRTPYEVPAKSDCRLSNTQAPTAAPAAQDQYVIEWMKELRQAMFSTSQEFSDYLYWWVPWWSAWK